jgi:electron transfer flavoprotein beta subunit
MKPDGTLNRSALPAVCNHEDIYALEMALQIRESRGGSICAATMGPPQAAEVLREALYRGADRAVLLTDRCFAASDTLATSLVLSCALRRLGPFDIVLCGRQAIDGNTAQVGPQIAEKLGINQLTYVDGIEDISGGHLTAWREYELGRQCVRAPLPVLLTVTDSAPLPRPPSAINIMRYKHARAPGEVSRDPARPDAPAAHAAIEQLGAEDLGIAPETCGLAGSPTRVKKIEHVVLKSTQHKTVPPTEQGFQELFRELIADYTFE